MSKEPRGFRRVSKRAAGISQWGGKLIGRPQSQSLSLSLFLFLSRFYSSIIRLSEIRWSPSRMENCKCHASRALEISALSKFPATGINPLHSATPFL